MVGGGWGLDNLYKGGESWKLGEGGTYEGGLGGRSRSFGVGGHLICLVSGGGGGTVDGWAAGAADT